MLHRYVLLDNLIKTVIEKTGKVAVGFVRKSKRSFDCCVQVRVRSTNSSCTNPQIF